MSHNLCLGLQSCLEPKLVDPLILRLKLTQPKSNHSSISRIDHDLNLNNEGNVEMGGWNFLQSLAGVNTPVTTTNSDPVFIHPLVKNSSSKLSEKSLEMCTERLGSETGSDGVESSDDTENSLFPAKQGPKNTKRVVKKLNSGTSAGAGGGFPPPLTSISGGNGVKVRPHREGGRLVLEAVSVSRSSSCFQADRSNGRLRLSVLEKSCDDFKEEDEDYVYGGNDESESEIGMFDGPIRRCKESGCGNEVLIHWDRINSSAAC